MEGLVYVLLYFLRGSLPWQGLQVCANICVFLLLSVSVCVYEYVCVCIYIYIYIHMCMNMYVCVYICRYVYVYIYLHTHTFIHTNTYTSQAANQKEKYHKICLKKQNIPVRELCKGLPPEFGTLLSYTRNLKFDEAPNYNYCRKLLREIFEQNCLTLDYVYDWTIKQVCFCCALYMYVQKCA